MSKKNILFIIIIVFCAGYYFLNRPNQRPVSLPDNYNVAKLNSLSEDIMDDLVVMKYENIKTFADQSFSKILETDATDKINEKILDAGSFVSRKQEKFKGYKNDKGKILAMATYKAKFEAKKLEFRLFFNEKYELVAIYVN